jgi:hypothetical protein
MHLQYCKRILNLRSSTPNFMVYGEIGRFPVEIIIKLRMATFWNNMLCNNNKLSSSMYRLMFKPHQSNPIHFIKLNGSSMGTCAAQLTCLRKVCGHVTVSDHRLSKPEGFNVSFYVDMW